jgi:capsular polysaccharide export protein
MMHIAARRRSFMVLQGPASPFFAQLGHALIRAGHEATRVNFCGGDRIFWPSRNCGDVLNFTGSGDEWPSFVRAEILRRGITDILVFGDCRPLHRAAASAAQDLGVAFWAFEEGYLRPDWITLEAGGTNGRSSLPRDPQDIFARASILPQTPLPAPISKGALPKLVVRQLAYEAASLLLRPLFPAYRTHRPFSPFVEARGWLRRCWSLRARRQSAHRVVDRIRDGLAEPYFLLPLQLDTDYQLRAYSPYGSMSDFLRHVIASFAGHAPPQAKLIAKIHPLHNGIPDLWREAPVIAEAFGVRDRVIVLEGGHLPTLLTKSAGVVTVNSTVGLSALGHARPVKVLGSAIYDVPGLTFQGTLDSFWHTAEGPDPALLSAFRRVVAHDSQINASFHAAAGVRLGVEAALRRLVGPPSGEYEEAGHGAAAIVPRPISAGRSVQASVAWPSAGQP